MSARTPELIRQLFRRVRLTVGRAVLTGVDDAPRMQTVQVEGLAGVVVDGAERFQQYGLSSHPVEGAEAVLFGLGGMLQHPVVASVDDRRYRPRDIAKGEVVVYGPKDSTAGQRVHFLANGDIRMEVASAFVELSPAKCVIDAAVIELRGASKTVRIP